MQLKEMMTTPVQTVTPDSSLEEVAKKMRTQDVGSLPVCDNNKIVGIVTDRDIAIRGVADGLNPAQTKVREVMTTQVHSCPAETDANEAFKIMEDKQIRRLIVTDQTQNPIGIISLGDIALRVHQKQAGEVVKEVSKDRQAA